MPVSPSVRIKVSGARGARGNQGNPGGDASQAGPFTQMAGMTMPATQRRLTLDGYSDMSRVSAPRFVRVASQPSHAGKFRTLDRFTPDGATSPTNGGWWELAEPDVRPEYFYSGTGAASAALLTAKAVAIAQNKPMTSALPSMLLDAYVDLRGVPFDLRNTKLLIDHNDIGVVIGGNSNSDYNPAQSLGDLARLNMTAIPNVVVIGGKGAKYFVGKPGWIDLYANSQPANSTDASIAYTEFEGVRWDKLTFSTNFATTGSQTQWLNEITFTGIRLKEVIVNGTYVHNHNKFRDCVFEFGSVTMLVGADFAFEGCRAEGGFTYYFAPGTWGNKIELSWNSNQQTPYFAIDFDGLITGTDDGEANAVVRKDALWQLRIPMLKVNPGNCRTFSNDLTAPGSTFEHVDLQAHAPGVFTRGTFRQVFASPTKVPVKNGDGFQFRSDAGFRPRVYIHDANAVQITDDTIAATALRTSMVWNATGKYFVAATDQAQIYGAVRSSQVRFIRVEVWSGGVAPVFTYFVWNLITTNRDGRRDAFDLLRRRNAPVTASPTRGFAQIGEIVSCTTGGIFQSTCAIDTTMTAGAITGATTISLGAVSTTAQGGGTLTAANGDRIWITLNTGASHEAVISSVTGNDATFAPGLPDAADAGKRVTIMRWRPMIPAVGIASGSTAAQIVAALKSAGLAV